MKQLNDQVRIKHMLDASKKAIQLIQGKSKQDFLEDETLILAITRLLEIIGEAANGVSSHLKQQHPHIAWREIIGARNHLIHGYFDVDNDIIWQILTSDLPPLVFDLSKVIES